MPKDSFLAQPPPAEDDELLVDPLEETPQTVEEEEEIPLDPPLPEPDYGIPLASVPSTPTYPDLVENVFPANQVHLIGGSQGSGKTAFEVWMYSHVMDERPFLGHTTHRPSFWGCLIFDRTADDRLHWWRQAGLETAPPYYCLTNDPDIDPTALDKMPFSKTFAFMTRKIEEFDPPPGSVITIDVANFFVGDVRLGYKSGFAHGWALSKYAADKKITIIAVVHGGKQKSHDRYTKLTDRIIASTGFLGSVGTVSYLTGADESNMNGIQEYQWIPHNAPSEKFELERTPEGLYRPFVKRTTNHKQASIDMIALADYAFPTGEEVSFASFAHTVKEGWDISERTAKRCIKTMVEKGLIKKVRHGFYQKTLQS